MFYFYIGCIFNLPKQDLVSVPSIDFISDGVHSLECFKRVLSIVCYSKYKRCILDLFVLMVMYHVAGSCSLYCVQCGQ